MLDTRLASAIKLWIASASLAVLLLGCVNRSNPEDFISLQIYQKWKLQRGESISGYKVLAGLGDIAIDLAGKPVYAPFDGQARQDQHQCLVFSSPDVPAYLFRLCGLSDLRLGTHNRGNVLGKGSILFVSTLRKQPDGTWALVEPSQSTLKGILSKP